MPPRALEKALAAETDPEIRAAMKRAWLAVQLFAGSREEQLAAIRGLGGTTDPQIKNLLDEFRNKPDLDPELRKAADGRARRDRPAACGWSGSPPTCSRASASAACCCSPRSGSPSPSA